MNTFTTRKYRKQVARPDGRVSALQIDYGVGETYEVAVNMDGYWEPIWRGDERPTGLLLLIKQLADDPRDYRYWWAGNHWAAHALSLLDEME